MYSSKSQTSYYDKVAFQRGKRGLLSPGDSELPFMKPTKAKRSSFWKKLLFGKANEKN